MIKFYRLCVAAFGVAFLNSQVNAQEALYTVPTIKELVALNPNSYPNVYVRGRVTVGDGGEGTFYNVNTTTSTNGGTVFAGTGSYSNRRWFRNYSGAAEIKWWGLDGTTGDYAKLTNAINSVDTIHFTKGTYRVSQNLDVPRSDKLIFDKGAMLSIDAGKTATIRGPVEAGVYQIFTGAGSVNFSTWPQIEQIPVSWFGADPTYEVDSTTAFQKSLAAAGISALPARVYVPVGQYKITSTLTVPSRVTIEGERLSSSLYFSATNSNAFMFTFASPGDNARIKGLSLVNYPATGITGSSAIAAITTNSSFISEISMDDLFLEGFERYGVYLDRITYPKLNRVRVMRTRSKSSAYPGTAIFMTNYVTACSMRECRINSNDAALQSGKLQGASIESCYFEANGDAALNLKDTIAINGGGGVSIKGCYFEGNFTGLAATNALLRLDNSSGVHVSGSQFIGDYGATTNTMNFAYVGAGSKGVVFNGNNFLCPIANFIMTDAATPTVDANKNTYYISKDTVPLTRYADIAARMSSLNVDIDVPSAFTWTPGILDDGGTASVTLPMAGAKKGRRDQILVHYDNVGAANMLVNGYVESDGLVRVVLENHSGLPLTIGAGTLSVRIQKLD